MRKHIEEVLDKVRPALEAHGGDVELIRIQSRSKKIYVRFLGTCDHCAISEITLKYLLEREIRANGAPEYTVVAV